MEVKDYPNESKSGLKEPKDVEPIANGKFSKRKHFSERAIKEKGGRIWSNIIWPNLRNIIINSFSYALGGGAQNNNTYNYRGQPTNYTNYSKQPQPQEDPFGRYVNAPEEAIKFETYEDAMNVLMDLKTALHKYEYVTLAYYYSISNRKSDIKWTFHDVGWILGEASGNQLESIQIPQHSGGIAGGYYYIPLPKPVSIK